MNYQKKIEEAVDNLLKEQIDIDMMSDEDKEEYQAAIEDALAGDSLSDAEREEYEDDLTQLTTPKFKKGTYSMDDLVSGKGGDRRHGSLIVRK